MSKVCEQWSKIVGIPKMYEDPIEESLKRKQSIDNQNVSITDNDGQLNKLEADTTSRDTNGIDLTFVGGKKSKNITKKRKRVTGAISLKSIISSSSEEDSDSDSNMITFNINKKDDDDIIGEEKELKKRKNSSIFDILYESPTVEINENKDTDGSRASKTDDLTIEHTDTENSKKKKKISSSKRTIPIQERKKKKEVIKSDCSNAKDQKISLDLKTDDNDDCKKKALTQLKSSSSSVSQAPNESSETLTPSHPSPSSIYEKMGEDEKIISTFIKIQSLKDFIKIVIVEMKEKNILKLLLFYKEMGTSVFQRFHGDANNAVENLSNEPLKLFKKYFSTHKSTMCINIDHMQESFISLLKSYIEKGILVELNAANHTNVPFGMEDIGLINILFNFVINV